MIHKLTGDLADKELREHARSSAVATSLSVGLVAGLIGGFVAGVFLAPWYQTNLGNARSGDDTAKQLILDEESAIISAVESVNPAVVSIVISKDLPKFEQFSSPFGGFFFEVPSGEIERQQVGAGSGFIATADGMIVTNKHVVSDSEAEYTVITKDGKRFDAEIIAIDPFNDLAVVKVEARNLPTLTLGDSAKLKLGQRVIAIGNALGEFQNTVTTGVVSGIGRNITASSNLAQTEKLAEVIQTDAAINPGNSGGPLVNLAGEVIGVNTAVSAQGQLIGFAIPVNQVKKVVSDVQEFGKVRRPFLGVRYTIITESVAQQNELPVNHGVLIVSGDDSQDLAVVPGSPADQAGLREGDIILEIDGREITVEEQLTDVLRVYNPDDRVLLKVYSDGREKTLSVVLGEAE